MAEVAVTRRRTLLWLRSVALTLCVFATVLFGITITYRPDYEYSDGQIYTGQLAWAILPTIGFGVGSLWMLLAISCLAKAASVRNPPRTIVFLDLLVLSLNCIFGAFAVERQAISSWAYWGVERYSSVSIPAVCVGGIALIFFHIIIFVQLKPLVKPDVVVRKVVKTAPSSSDGRLTRHRFSTAAQQTIYEIPESESDSQSQMSLPRSVSSVRFGSQRSTRRENDSIFSIGTLRSGGVMSSLGAPPTYVSRLSNV